MKERNAASPQRASSIQVFGESLAGQQISINPQEISGHAREISLTHARPAPTQTASP
jgi:hypothetical protein